VQAALAWLERHSTPHDLANLARFGITAAKPFGVSVANIRALAKQLGRNHDLAAALWDTGRYEARIALADAAQRSAKPPCPWLSAWLNPRRVLRAGSAKTLSANSPVLPKAPSAKPQAERPPS